MGSPKRMVRHAAREHRFLTLDDLDAFLQDARLSGARGREAIHIGGHLWNAALRKVRVEVTPTGSGYPVTAYVEPPAAAARALRRHYSPHEVQVLARLLTQGASPNRTPTPRQSDTVHRKAVVEYQAPGKRTLTLDEIAAFAQEADRLGARSSRHIEGQPKLLGNGLKWISVVLENRPAPMPVTVCLESPAATAAALRRGLRLRDVRELARLLAVEDAPALDEPAPAGRGGQPRQQPLGESGLSVTRKVKVEHETELDLSLDDVAVFIREARRLGATGGEIVKAGTPPRYHGPTLWNISVEVELPPADRVVSRVRNDVHRLAEAAEVVRRHLGPDDVLKLVSLLVADGVPTSGSPFPAEGAAPRSPGRWRGERAVTTRKVKVEHPSRHHSLTLGEVHRFIHLADQAGALGGEIVTDPSNNWEPLSLCLDVELGPLERLVANARVDLPQHTARALRSVLDSDDLRELARRLAPDRVREVSPSVADEAKPPRPS